MLDIRRATDRGHADHGWLDSHHTFSFASYFDPRHMGWSALRVINEDRVEGGAGFGTHPHRDMEIVSYVLGGALEHKDSMGTGSVIRPGDVQLMSAGTGVLHSEYNHSKEEKVHFLQIWLLPEEQGGKPGYQQHFFAEAEKRGRLRLIVSKDGADGSLKIKQDARIFAGLFTEGEAATHELATPRRAWIHVARGTVRINGQELSAGDGVAIADEPTVRVEGVNDAEILLFDLP